MKSPTSEEVISFIKHDRSLAAGKNLYNRFPGRSLALQSAFNRMVENKENVQRVCYELCRMVGINERTMNVLTGTPVIPSPSAPQGGTKEPVKDPSPELTKEERIKEMPDPVREKIKLWEQFPFLREDDCPDIFKILVNDMIRAYNNYMEAQPKLHDALTDEDRKAIADTVKDNYIENKQIWKEMEHYQEHKEILGEHPIFEMQKDQEEIAALETEDLPNKIDNLEANLRRNSEKASDESRDAELRANNKDLAEKYEQLLAFAKEELKTRKKK